MKTVAAPVVMKEKELQQSQDRFHVDIVKLCDSQRYSAHKIICKTFPVSMSWGYLKYIQNFKYP